MGYMSERNVSQAEGTANDKDVPGISSAGQHRTTLLSGRRGWVQALQYQGRSLGCPPPQFPKMYQLPVEVSAEALQAQPWEVQGGLTRGSFP